MPHIHVLLPHGRFDATARRTIAERLSSGILAAEGLPETPKTKAMTSVVVEESDPTTWSVAGEPVGNRKQLHAFVRITTFASLLDPNKRAAMLATANSAIVDVAGGDPLGGLGVWVVINEIADGSWGMAGRPIGLAEIQAFNASTVRPPTHRTHG
jgi:phenylpyruvate tautomerase PptA (4-oxalocrotonate tautomerase family)